MVSIIFLGILFLVILIVGHEFGHFFAAKALGIRVDEFGFGFPPRLFSKRKGETRYSFNLLPFGGFVKIHGEDADGDEVLEEPDRSFVYQQAWKRTIVIISGAFMNFLIGGVALAIVFSVGLPTRVFIDEVLPGSPAAEAGLEAGVPIEGYESAEEFARFIRVNEGNEVFINSVAVTPRENPPEGEGPLGIILFEAGVERQGIMKSFVYGFRDASQTTWLMTKAFGGIVKGLFTGSFTAASQVSGPVGIFTILGETANLGVAPLIQFLGLISLNLVVINMIPFPALDGGRFLFILLEKVFGRKLNHTFETAANGFGIILMLVLMVIVTARDIMKLL